MDLKVTFVIVCLCALAITSTEAGIPKCCINTRATISRHLLRKVERSYVQLGNGACDIPALVLYIKGNKRPICAPLKLKTLLESPSQRRKQNKVKPVF